MLEFLTGLAIAMIIEGMMPFISPRSWKVAMVKIAELKDTSIRRFGFVVMLSGVLMLSIIR